ncbi:MAG: hypothetical protein IKD58_06005 [Loktanella sp.]|nr:hypothetical protein [Loktanella sp.]
MDWDSMFAGSSSKTAEPEETEAGTVETDSVGEEAAGVAVGRPAGDGGTQAVEETAPSDAPSDSGSDAPSNSEAAAGKTKRSHHRKTDGNTGPVLNARTVDRVLELGRLLSADDSLLSAVRGLYGKRVGGVADVVLLVLSDAKPLADMTGLLDRLDGEAPDVRLMDCALAFMDDRGLARRVDALVGGVFGLSGRAREDATRVCADWSVLAGVLPDLKRLL